MYCLCSSVSHDELLELQRRVRLPFDSFIEENTSCNSGCGSCIELLRERFASEGLLKPFSEPEI